jgi:hypothetical protein
VPGVRRAVPALAARLGARTRPVPRPLPRQRDAGRRLQVGAAEPADLRAAPGWSVTSPTAPGATNSRRRILKPPAK